MHLHWSSLPPPEAQNILDPSNDWLGSPFSSHVNNHFWKLHGWIEDRIIVWEDAHGTEANLSQGWDGSIGDLMIWPRDIGRLPACK
ncbi:hypothetical protein [Paenibacillus sp. JJ1722]|uniref:hypothetical protein n=1 Tax=Paenibacillus sp. JJ1722 TaxID=3398770 RepID=UPI003AAE8EEE